MTMHLWRRTMAVLLIIPGLALVGRTAPAQEGSTARSIAHPLLGLEAGAVEQDPEDAEEHLERAIALVDEEIEVVEELIQVLSVPPLDVNDSGSDRTGGHPLNAALDHLKKAGMYLRAAHFLERAPGLIKDQPAVAAGLTSDALRHQAAAQKDEAAAKAAEDAAQKEGEKARSLWAEAEGLDPETDLEILEALWLLHHRRKP